MVLDESTATNSDFTFDHSPNSDNDPYSSSSLSPTEPIAVQLKDLPRPPPIIGPLFGYTQARNVQAINEHIVTAAQLLRRPPTQDEASALAYYSAKKFSTTAWGHPFGLAGGIYRATQTSATYRFPFVAPNKETFNPNSFGWFLKLEGKNAQLMWHVLRGSAYGLLGSFIGGLLVGTYAATVAAVGERQDPRLRELLQGIRDVVGEAREKSRATRQAKAVGSRRDTTGQGPTSAGKL